MHRRMRARRSIVPTVFRGASQHIFPKFESVSSSPIALAYVALALAAMLIGGSSKSYPWLDITVQLVALAALLVTFWTAAWRPFLNLPMLARCFVIGILALPVLHLLPLPAGIWSSLGGRDVVVNVLNLIDKEGAWHSLSLAPDGSRSVLLALLPAAAAFLLMLSIPLSALRPVLALIMSIIFSSLMIGVIQVVSDGTIFPFYENFYAGSANGLLANRNHHADLLAIGIAMLVIWRAPPSRRKHHHGHHRAAAMPAWALWLIGTAFFAGVLATQSRAGLVVTLLAVVMTGLYLFRWDRRAAARAAGVLAVMIVLGTVAVLSSARVRAIGTRFASAGDDPRPQIWQATIDGASAFFPFGSGLGSFDVIYPMHESLEFLSRPNVNAAHNDYLELWLTGGVPAALLVILLFAIIGLALRNFLLSSRTRVSADIVFTSTTALVVLLAHSIFDYPLQTHALSFLFATFLALLLRFSYSGPDVQAWLTKLERSGGRRGEHASIRRAE